MISLGRVDLLDGLVAIAIEEVKYKKGHKYFTEACDRRAGRPCAPPWRSSWATRRGVPMVIGSWRSEVFETDPPADRAAKLKTLPEFERAQMLYRLRHFEAAADIYDRIVAQSPNDRPAEKLAARCRALAGTSVPEHRDGAIQVETSAVIV